MALSQTVDYFNFVHFPNMTILKTKDRFYFAPFFIYFPKRSGLLKTFNYQIKMHATGGLVRFWEMKYRKSSMYKKEPIQPKQWSLGDFRGTFLLCAYFLPIPILTLIFERLSCRCKLIKRFMDFLHSNGEEST